MERSIRAQQVQKTKGLGANMSMNVHIHLSGGVKAVEVLQNLKKNRKKEKEKIKEKNRPGKAENRTSVRL